MGNLSGGIGVLLSVGAIWLVSRCWSREVSVSTTVLRKLPIGPSTPMVVRGGQRGWERFSGAGCWILIVGARRCKGAGRRVKY